MKLVPVATFTRAYFLGAGGPSVHMISYFHDGTPSSNIFYSEGYLSYAKYKTENSINLEINV